MNGVAHTCGDHNHKEIHLSLEYIKQVEPRAKPEISGVITHEVVHCFQYNGKGTCPSGLIEGIAGPSYPLHIGLMIMHIVQSDYARMHAVLATPHWNPAKGEKWDAGYATTAYFLDWLERLRENTVRRLNALMKDSEYNDTIFNTVAGDNVHNLWDLYCAQRDISK